MRLFVLLAVFVTANLASASVAAADPSPEALEQAARISVDTGLRYHDAADTGRTLWVGDPASMGIVETLTLVTSEWELLRVVPANNGIYYPLCNRRDLGGTCGYPVTGGAWQLRAFRPRMMAFELAVRTFQETTADLVVVALPTATPAWVIFERDDFYSLIDPGTLWRQILIPVYRLQDRFSGLVDRFTIPRLYRPLPLLPPPPGTFVATRLLASPR